MSEVFAKWPEKFVYVCPATGAAPVWGLAFDHAPDRIVAMVILVGHKSTTKLLNHPALEVGAVTIRSSTKSKEIENARTLPSRGITGK